MPENKKAQAIVIGGGQAGLATGYHLRKAGLSFSILEASDAPGGSWPRYYNHLTLFSPARFSSLPGMPFPGKPNHYPHRDDVVTYLRDYALRFDLPIVTEVSVQQVRSAGDGFCLHASNGSVHTAQTVVAATGSFRTPHIPQLPGQGNFQGQILHSASYREPASFAGQRVIVVGGGNSAVQIAVELSRVADVTLASRRPVRFVPQRIAGCDVHCWLHGTGLDFTPWLKDHSAPVLDTGVYRKALAGKRPEQRSMFLRFTNSGVVWPETGYERIDTLIFATGYHPNFPYLRELNALDASGVPLQSRGVSTVPGLYFVGMSGQRSLRSATLRGVGADAAFVVRSLKRHLNVSRSPAIAGGRNDAPNV